MLFFDLEINKTSKKVEDIGAIFDNFEFRNSNIEKFKEFIDKHNPKYYAGHNIVSFDLKFLNDNLIKKLMRADNVVDTLYLSALLFPKKPYHNLIKDDKLVTNYLNNPLNDSIKSKHLLGDILNEFNNIDSDLKDIYYLLLNDKIGFEGFFKYLNYKPHGNNLSNLIRLRFSDSICLNKNIDSIIEKYPIELAYSLSYINTRDTNNSLVPPWLLNNYSNIENILSYLRNKPCHIKDCSFCNKNLSAIDGLKRYFNYPSFRTFDGANLQEDAVNSALNDESLIAVFPTGGGKSLTFQLPALISAENISGLTIVISPLLSLMKDQVDNLRKKGINNAEFINSLLSSVERKSVIERVSNGQVNILYIAPESLRSRTIERLLLKRQVVRFVIDEAHCFSTWGHDFRVDYLYIGDFIKNLMKKKELTKSIPVSCFTATAKQNVIDDIIDYFKDKLDLSMELFKTESGRKNLEYNVIKIYDDSERYLTLRNLLEGDDRPTIIYTSRTTIVEKLYKRLSQDNFKVSKFHGKMENEDKISNQNSFMEGKTNIMVATNAFGMGVDKDDVGVVIHYNISDSLENYVQEAGRAGRDEKIDANCYILYHEDDLDMHFEMLRNSKLSIKEISQVWSGIKRETVNSDEFTKTAFEIANTTGWDVYEMNDVETRVKTSILALEDANYLIRGLNSPRVFATSLLVSNLEQAINIIKKSNVYNNEEDIEISKLIVSSLISNKRRSWSDDLAEARVDYLSDFLGFDKRTIIKNINLLKEAKILADDSDLYARINEQTVLQTLITSLNRYKEIFTYLLNNIYEERLSYNIKELNENFDSSNYKPNIKYLRIALNYLEQNKTFRVEKSFNNTFYANLLIGREESLKKFDHYFKIADFIINYLFIKHKRNNNLDTKSLIDFSILELKNKYIQSLGIIKEEVNNDNIEDVLLLLQKLNILTFDGGFFVSYLPLTIKRIEKNNNVRYTKEKYSKLSFYYKSKEEQIHIVGRYAELMSEDKDLAHEYVSDYFNMYYNAFIDKHFPGRRKRDLDLKMSKNRHKKLFGNLTDEQKEIINDDKSKIIGVAAGPGSGKTTLLAHKLASIIYNEDVRTEQLLMLTFSRSAALEFRERLKALIGNVANYIKITTFHSFAFDLLGKVGNINQTQNVIKEAYELIRNREADEFKITKMMLVIDEAQDISLDEYNLIKELINFNDDMRVIAVGDDDQNIYEFRGSDSKYLKEFSKDKLYELTVNFRSKNNIVNFSNELIKFNKDRLKTKTLKSYFKDNGNIKVIKYENNNLIKPLVESLIKDPKRGTTAIVTKINEEARVVSGLLSEYGIENNLILNDLKIKAFNVYEIRWFYNKLKNGTETKIDISFYKNILDSFEEMFKDSKNLEISSNLLNKFIEVYNEPYITDLFEYLVEIEITDYANLDKLVVANLHKVKGLEFDNVIVLYENNIPIKPEELRALYVGITRSRNNIEIHTTNSIFENIKNEEYEYVKNYNSYSDPENIEISLGYKDIFLSHFENKEERLIKLNPGEQLTLKNKILMYKNQRIGMLSFKGYELLNDRIDKGYTVKSIMIDYLAYWYNKEKEKEILVVLPSIKFTKNEL